jgi:hypothetical protein
MRSCLLLALAAGAPFASGMVIMPVTNRPTTVPPAAADLAEVCDGAYIETNGDYDCDDRCAPGMGCLVGDPNCESYGPCVILAQTTTAAAGGGVEGGGAGGGGGAGDGSGGGGGGGGGGGPLVDGQDEDSASRGITATGAVVMAAAVVTAWLVL